MTTPPFKILVAMAEAGEREAMTNLLGTASLPCQIENVERSDLALDALSSKLYDCAIVDAELPHNNGNGIFGAISKQGIHTPVIMLGDGGVGGRDDMIKQGAADCLPREGYSADQLLRSMSYAARLHRAESRAAEAQQVLSHRTLHDALTELPNRALFIDRLEQLVAFSSREQRLFALLVMGLNRFREINTNLGHATGDELLREVARRLSTISRDSDTLARLGGDEFGRLLPTAGTVAGAITASQRIVDALSKPISILGHNLAVGISVGIAVFPTHGRDAAALLRHADKAMHLAKRNSCALTVYAGEDDPDGLRHLSLSGDLQSAVQQNEMSLRFQPKVRMQAATFSGVEVLLRWKHPWHGMISPDVFIPLAEQTGIIEPLTRWVLDQALKQQAEWRAEGFDVSVSVNLSPRTLHDTTFPKQVAATLERWKTPAGRLSLEITESAIMSDVVRATETAQWLSAMGVRISIDDFGTGYTSFAYIRKLPISEIKVDKSFVLNMKNANDDEVIVRSIVTLGRNLGVDVVAEGVEDQEAWALLAGLACTEAQGYFISRPVSANALGRWMRESRWVAHAPAATD